MREESIFQKMINNMWEIVFFMWVIGSLVECSFTANPQTGVSVGVQTKQEERKVEVPKKEIKTDGPQGDW